MKTSATALFKNLSVGDVITVTGFSNGQPVLERVSLDDGATTPGVVTSSKPVTAPTVNTLVSNHARSRAMTVYTRETLPDPKAEGVGARAFVTDAVDPRFGEPYVGAGSSRSPVYSDGSKWIIG